MEADWEIEIGGDAPVIDADWLGFVDLRVLPARVNAIAETRQQPGLAQALVRLNADDSPVWTCKTDVFVPERVDPDELDAPHDEAAHAVACYIDLLMRGTAWKLILAEGACRLWRSRLRKISLQCCRVDLVIRRAHMEGGDDLGVTAYLTACGQTIVAAKSKLEQCLKAFGEVIVAKS
jgi:hypothetical protein